MSALYVDVWPHPTSPVSAVKRTKQTNSLLKVSSFWIFTRTSRLPGQRHSLTAQRRDQTCEMAMIVAPATGGTAVNGTSHLGGTRRQRHRLIILNVDGHVEPT